MKSEISTSSHLSLQAVKALADYQAAPAASRDAAVTKFKEWLSDPITKANETVCLLAASVLASESEFSDALRALHDCSGMEQYVHILRLIAAHMTCADTVVRCDAKSN